MRSASRKCLPRRSNLTYVPADLEDRRLGEKLVACASDRGRRACCGATAALDLAANEECVEMSPDHVR
jgi:hypothetical protein